MAKQLNTASQGRLGIDGQFVGVGENDGLE